MNPAKGVCGECIHFHSASETCIQRDQDVTAHCNACPMFAKSAEAMCTAELEQETGQTCETCANHTNPVNRFGLRYHRCELWDEEIRHDAKACGRWERKAPPPKVTRYGR